MQAKKAARFDNVLPELIKEGGEELTEVFNKIVSQNLADQGVAIGVVAVVGGALAEEGQQSHMLELSKSSFICQGYAEGTPTPPDGGRGRNTS